MKVDEQIAEPSAAAVPTFNPGDNSTWTPEQRDHWNETGEIPKPKEQESAPVAPPAKVADSDTEAEPEAATTQGRRKPGEKLNAQERIAQLTAKVRELETERERSREAAPKPPATETKVEAKTETPKRPNPFNWKGTAEEYETALDTWEKHQKAQAIEEFQRNANAEIQRQRLQAQYDEAKAKYPDAEAKINESLKIFTAELPKLPGAIQSMFDDSEVLTELMYVFSDPATRDNFIDAAKKTPGKAIRALAQMETDIVAKRTVKPETKVDPPPVEPKPRAPKPVPEVGGRNTPGPDSLVAAADSGDFDGFSAEMNRRKFAKN
jgi:hypothetical protein